MGRSTPAKARCAHFGIARQSVPHSILPGFGLGLGITLLWLSLIVLLPLSALAVEPKLLLLGDRFESLFTREAPAFRDRMAELCADTLSAGSHVTPGGYAHPTDQTAQFSLADTRSAAEVIAALRTRHLDPIFKQWA